MRNNKTQIDMSVAFLFPGQGSHVPGMLHTLPDHPSIERTLDEVSEALGEKVLELNSREALRSTVSVQLASLAPGVAMARLSSQKVSNLKQLRACRREPMPRR